MTEQACIHLIQLFGISFDALKTMPDFGADEAKDGVAEAVPETPTIEQQNGSGNSSNWSTSAQDKILRTLRKLKAFIRLVDLQVTHTLADVVVKSVVAIKKHVDEESVSKTDNEKGVVTPFVILEADPEDKAEPMV